MTPRRALLTVTALILLAAFGRPVIRAAREFWRGYSGGQAGWWEF